MDIKKIIQENSLMNLAKECLSIVETSTLKDKEIYMLVESAILDLDRVDIDVESNIEDGIVKNTIMLYVKAHFGDTETTKRRMYLQRYKSNLRELQFSDKYKKKESESNA